MRKRKDINKAICIKCSNLGKRTQGRHDEYRCNALISCSGSIPKESLTKPYKCFYYTPLEDLK